MAHLKQLLPNPPMIVLVTAYMSSNELVVSSKEICPEADAYFAKDAELDILSEQLKQLLV